MRDEYVRRLMRCGYGEEQARTLYVDFRRNLTFMDLEFFVAEVEKRHVGAV